MKILVFAPVPLNGENTHLGGGVSFSYMAIINMLKDKGHEVKYMSPWHNLDPMFIWLYPGFRDIRFNSANRYKIEDNIKWADKVLLPDSMSNAMVLKIANKLKKPTILCNHTDYLKIAYTSSRKRFGYLPFLATRLFVIPVMIKQMKLLANCSTFFLTTTTENKNNLVKHAIKLDGLFDNIGPKTAIFRENDCENEIAGIRTRLLEGTSFKNIILYAGRIAYEKRIQLLFDARPKDSLLVIVGDGPAAKRIVKYHDPKNGVLFINKMLTQDKLRKLIKATDLSVSASNFETLGMSVYETWLCGNKSVVQNDGGFRDQIKDLSYGKLTNFENSSLAMAAIEEVLNDKTALAIHPALPKEKCIEEYLIEANEIPKISTICSLILSAIDMVTLFFVTRKSREKKSLSFTYKGVGVFNN